MVIRKGLIFSGALFVYCFYLTTSSWATQKASGILIAEKVCPAYSSMRKKTNPGSVYLAVGMQYPVFEINLRPEGIWYRIRITDAQPSERWVAPDCGRPKEPMYPRSKLRKTEGEDYCRTPDMFDSYVFAVSWQPAFCDLNSRKPECAGSNASAYQASNFTLHGLWPNRKECGTGYGFCGEYRQASRSFCDYPNLELNQWVRRALDVVMPSSAAGSCLQRHQWYKHGTCQTQWTKDEYFAIASQLTMAFNGSGIGAYMASNLGKEIKRDDFNTQIDSFFGEGAHERMEFFCENGNLVEIYIRLPKVIKKSDTLSSLMAKVDAQENRSNCPNYFKVNSLEQ